MSKRKRICDAAVEVLRETGNTAVMWGDVALLHRIAIRAGRPSRGARTERLVINALSRQPGLLEPGRTRVQTNHGPFGFCGTTVRIFRLPAQKEAS